METCRSLEISLQMPPSDDDERSVSHKHSSKKTLRKPKRVANYKKIKTYENLIKILRENERYFKYKVVPEIFIFLCLIGIIVATFIGQQFKRHLLLGLEAWKWISLIGAAFCGLSIIRLCTHIVLYYLIEPMFKLAKNVVFFARGLKTSVDIFLWLVVLLIFWLVWFRKGIESPDYHTAGILHYVTQTLIGLLLGASGWLLKDILLLRLESGLHLNRFFSRIRCAILHVHGIQLVDKRGDWCFARIQEREMFLENVYKMEKGVPTWVLKSLANLFEKSLKEVSLPHASYEFCDDKALIDHAGSKLLQKVVHSDDRSTCNRGTSVGSTVMDEVYRLGKFSNRCIGRDDLKHRLNLTEKEAHVLLRLLPVYDTEKDPHHQHKDEVEHKTFIIWVTHAYRTCWSMKRSLKNSREAMSQLNKLLTGFLVVVVVVIWLLLTEIATQSTLALGLSPFLAASFIFGNSCKAMFDGIIFAFVMHPFEVGDRCAIDGEQMRVNRINILTTELFKYDKGESVIYPNSVLASKDISNSRAILNQEDILLISIDPATRWEEIEEITARIKRSLQENPHLCSDAEVVMEDFGKIAVHFKYLVAHPNSTEKAKWKSELITTIRKILQQLEIQPVSSLRPIKIHRVERRELEDTELERSDLNS